jgi:hypothetical protein
VLQGTALPVLHASKGFQPASKMFICGEIANIHSRAIFETIFSWLELAVGQLLAD